MAWGTKTRKLEHAAAFCALVLGCALAPAPLEATTRLDAFRLELTVSQEACREPGVCALTIAFVVDIDRVALAGELGVAATESVSATLECHGGRSGDELQPGPAPIQSVVDEWPWEGTMDFGPRCVGAASGTCWLVLLVEGEPFYRTSRQFWFDAGNRTSPQISRAEFLAATQSPRSRQRPPFLLGDFPEEQ